MGIGRTAALGLALALAAPAGAATVDYTSFHVLGDSLSDVGNVYRLSFGRIPESPPYWRGRFSNGPVWADRVADAFRDDGPADRQPRLGRRQRASAAASTSPTSRCRARATARSTTTGSATGRSWRSGAAATTSSTSPGSSGVRRAARDVAERLGDVAIGLRRSGTRDFVILNLPDIGAIPKYRRRSRPTAAPRPAPPRPSTASSTPRSRRCATTAPASGR